jgi:hypothetical protein
MESGKILIYISFESVSVAAILGFTMGHEASLNVKILTLCSIRSHIQHVHSGGIIRAEFRCLPRKTMTL